jgi:hypothetical protein
LQTSSTSFHFDFIPDKTDQSGIKLLKNVSNSFTLEYAVFEPKTVHICMHAKPKRHFFKVNSQSAVAILQQFIITLGLHADYLKPGIDPIPKLLSIIKPQFLLDPLEPCLHSGGLLGLEMESSSLPMNDGFINGLLEIITEDPTFALFQIPFKSHKIPKEFQSVEITDFRNQTRFNIQQGKVERRSQPISMNLMEEAGCFKFSTRLLLVERTEARLHTKLERVSVFLKAHGIKTRKYPSFLRSFNRFKSHIRNRSFHPGMLTDGFTLMNFLSFPTNQYSLFGYQIVPHKERYQNSSTLSQSNMDDTIKIGIPILSGKTANSPIVLSGKDLSRHMAVFGMTGEGKSRFIFNLIKEFHQNQVKFLIIDPKGEYIHPVQTFCQEFIYLKPGSESFPWGINIFEVPMDPQGQPLISPEDHIQFVVSLLENVVDEGNSLSPQMRRLIQLATIQTIKEKGDFRLFVQWLDKPNALGLKGAYLENTSAGTINRVTKLLFGNTGRCFTVSSTSFDISQILSQNVILDLSSFEAMEDINGRQLLLEVIFQYLYYYIRKFRPPFKEEKLPQNVIILDEINKLLPAPSYRQSTPKSIIGRGPWTLRAYDVSMVFIGTDPMIDLPMLTNAGVFAMFYSKFDPYKVANLLGVSKDAYDHLTSLLKAKPDERRCLLSVNKNVTLIKTDQFDLDSSSVSNIELLRNNPVQIHLRKNYTRNYFQKIHD